MASKEQLLQKLKSREARIGVVGLGYVGLPLALRFCEAGFPVTGFDIDAAKVGALNAGKSYIAQIGAERVAAAVTKRFTASADFNSVRHMDALILCVPTPLGR